MGGRRRRREEEEEEEELPERGEIALLHPLSEALSGEKRTRGFSYFTYFGVYFFVLWAKGLFFENGCHRNKK